MTIRSPFRFDGGGSDFWFWTTPSWSGTMEDGEVVEYTVSLNLRNGELDCDCPDSEYRKKQGHILDPKSPLPCKHVRRLQEIFSHVLPQPQEE